MPQPTIKLYGFGPTRSSRCLWTLRELGVVFQEVEVDLPAGEHRQPWFLALNPMGRVPVLQHGDLLISESAAICLYLADRFPGPGLAPPPGTGARARHDRWVFFAMTELDQPLWRIRRHRVIYPEERRIPGEIHNARADFLQAAAVLERELSERLFLVDERFTVADVLTAQTLAWAGWYGLLDSLPGLQLYLDRQLERPACPPILRPR